MGITIFTVNLLHFNYVSSAGLSRALVSRGYPLVVVRGLLTVVASLVVEHEL